MNDRSLMHGLGRTTANSLSRSSKQNNQQQASNNSIRTYYIPPHQSEDYYSSSSAVAGNSRNHQTSSSPSTSKIYDSGTAVASRPHFSQNPKRMVKTAVVTARRRSSHNDNKSLALDCTEITRMLEEGPLKFRIFVLFGAIFMVVANIMDYNKTQYSDYYGSGVGALFFVISLYIWLFGAFIITLEMRPFRSGVSLIHRAILEQVSFLRFTWGRGFLYFFSGSLQFVLFTQWNMIAGGVMIILGIASVIFGRLASNKLKTLVKNIGNRNNLLDKFKMHDKDHDGYLNVREFRNFVRDMGVKLNDDELTNAFMAIDRDCDRKITFQDLSNWYANAKYDVKTDGVII